MTTLKDQLMASLRHLVLDRLPYDSQDADVVSDLNAMKPDELLILWLNWNRRIPPPKPRQVLQSKEFLANSMLKARNTDIQALIADIQSGAELTKYLSLAVRHGYINPKSIKLHQRQDLDLMLNAWSIHHLHCSQDVEADGFVKRDGPIIFAAFRSDTAFLIDIMTHRDWAREHIIKVIVNNWLDEGLVHELKGAIGLSHFIDDDQRQKLRNHKINTPLEIEGKVYMPTGGMTLSGLGIDAVMQAQKAIMKFENFASEYESDPQKFASLAQEKGLTWPARPDFAVCFIPDSYGVMELQSGIFLKLGP
jgi:hypothetical protein